jgi:glycosyltransferase involved in cell wall biosynthesis
MIAVLLSTYNGEKYLEEQLQSILNQTCIEKWCLYIRDDGSTDNTLNIIDRYVSEYDQFFKFEDEERGLGPALSFLHLLSNISAEYYMFCDQDDFWLPDKMETCFRKHLELNKGNDTPILIHTDLLVVDQDLNLLNRSFWGKNLSSDLVQKYMPITNFVTGCTMFFNKAARDCSIDFIGKKVIMHDHWVALCVWAHQGIIFSISEPTIKYRQHGSNVLGAFKKKISIIDRILKSIRHNLDVLKMVRLQKKISIIDFLYLKFSYSLIKKQIKNVQ